VVLVGVGAVLVGPGEYDVNSMGLHLVNIPFYNCAENYDKFVELAKNNPNPKGKQYDLVMFEGLVLISGLYENRCFITVETWAYESMYEDMIWMSDWKRSSWENRLLLGEVEPNNKGDERDILNYQASKKALEQTDNYADYGELNAKIKKEKMR